MGRDAITGCLLLGLSLWLYRQTAEIPRPHFVSVGPDVYPRILLGLLAGLSVALLGADLLNRGGRRGRGGGRPEARIHRASYRDVFLTYLLFGGYTALIPILGFRAATVSFVAVLSWCLGPKTVRHAVLCLLVAFVFVAAVHLMFEGYLRLLLPRGILP